MSALRRFVTGYFVRANKAMAATQPRKRHDAPAEALHGRSGHVLDCRVNMNLMPCNS
jgi:hypothetical protein